MKRITYFPLTRRWMPFSVQLGSTSVRRRKKIGFVVDMRSVFRAPLQVLLATAVTRDGNFNVEGGISKLFFTRAQYRKRVFSRGAERAHHAFQREFFTTAQSKIGILLWGKKYFKGRHIGDFSRIFSSLFCCPRRKFLKRIPLFVREIVFWRKYFLSYEKRRRDEGNNVGANKVFFLEKYQSSKAGNVGKLRGASVHTWRLQGLNTKPKATTLTLSGVA